MTQLASFETPILPEGKDFIHLFRPHIPAGALQHIGSVLQSRWIGQGPMVEKFERMISEQFCQNLSGVAVGSGTDALHLAYLLAGVEEGDEVIVPLFTCTATSIPLLYIGAKPIFVDIDHETLNIDSSRIEERITSKTKAIAVVHYGGLPCDMNVIHDIATRHGLAVIEDAAHALGATFEEKPIGSLSDFTMFSFQAIKHVTTGDGGYLSIKNPDLLEKAKRLRWFGIDRSAKQRGIWENDISEIGYKYQMTDLSAALGIASLEEFQSTLSRRRTLFDLYCQLLEDTPNVRILGTDSFSDRKHAAWMFTIASPLRREIQKALFENGIESSQVHFRNDRYSIFGGRTESFPNMDALEEQYLVLPLHTELSTDQVERVANVVKLIAR